MLPYELTEFIYKDVQMKKYLDLHKMLGPSSKNIIPYGGLI